MFKLGAGARLRTEFLWSIRSLGSEGRRSSRMRPLGKASRCWGSHSTCFVHRRWSTPISIAANTPSPWAQGIISPGAPKPILPCPSALWEEPIPAAQGFTASAREPPECPITSPSCGWSHHTALPCGGSHSPTWPPDTAQTATRVLSTIIHVLSSQLDGDIGCNPDLTSFWGRVELGRVPNMWSGPRGSCGPSCLKLTLSRTPLQFETVQ